MSASVILVDDQASTRMALGALLRDAGYRVLALAETDAALAALAERHYDVVITDILMPKRSGLELLDEVAHRWPEVAVILITGEPNIGSAARAVRAGAYDYLAQPFSSDQLVEAIRAALARRERRASARVLRETEAGLSALIDAAPAAILVFRDTLVVAANEALLQLVKRRVEDVVGGEVVGLFHSDDRERVIQRSAHLAETGRPKAAAPVRLLHADGSVAYCIGRGVAVRYQGLPSIVVVLSEVSLDAWNAKKAAQEP